MIIREIIEVSYQLVVVTKETAEKTGAGAFETTHNILEEDLFQWKN